MLAKLAGQSLLGEATEEDADDALSAAATLERLAGGSCWAYARSPRPLALILVESLSYEDAALALGVPVGTVRSRLSRPAKSYAMPWTPSRPGPSTRHKEPAMVDELVLLRQLLEADPGTDDPGLAELIKARFSPRGDFVPRRGGTGTATAKASRPTQRSWRRRRAVILGGVAAGFVSAAVPVGLASRRRTYQHRHDDPPGLLLVAAAGHLPPSQLVVCPLQPEGVVR